MKIIIVDGSVARVNGRFAKVTKLRKASPHYGARGSKPNLSFHYVVVSSHGTDYVSDLGNAHIIAKYSGGVLQRKRGGLYRTVTI